MKKFFKGFKNWIISNRRTLIQLFCWLLFMTLLIIFIRYLNDKKMDNNEDSYKKVEILGTMDNYIYECLYNDIRYTGRVFNNGTEEMYVEENGTIKTFYYDKEWYEKIDDDLVLTSEYVHRIKPNEIYSIIELSDYIKNEEEQGFMRYQFEVLASELGYDDDNTIYINVYLKDDKFVSADLLGQYCAYNLVEGE